MEVTAKRSEKHSMDELEGSKCNGCNGLSIIPQKGRRREPFRCYCDVKRKRVDPWKEECDERL